MTYVERDLLAPVAEAIDQVEKATGLSIIVDGPTDDIPSGTRPIYVDRYWTPNSPVLLAWSRSGQCVV